MSNDLREQIARIVDPYIPNDLVCLGMEYELADEIIGLLSAQGMSAGTAKTPRVVEAEGRQPGSRSECAQDKSTSPFKSEGN